MDEKIKFDEDIRSSENALIVVRVYASPENRSVIAKGYLNGDLIASASAVDYKDPQHPSPSTQSFTMPVKRGDSFRIEANATNCAEARLFIL